MRISLFLAAFIIFSGPFGQVLFSDSIDLVALQKKEAERRKKTNKSKYKLTNTSLVILSSGKKKMSYVKTDQVFEDNSKEKKKTKKKKEDPRAKKDYWIKKIRSTDENILKLKEQITKTQLELNKAQTDYLTLSLPLEINNAKENFDKLNKKIQELKKKLEMEKIAKENIYEDARKSNIPPGWLR